MSAFVRQFTLVLGLFLAAAITSATTSIAGDTAQRQIIGFSPDGLWFAFEEFGTADGTGAPYSNIYVVNTDKDVWPKGSPIRVRFGETVAPISKARNLARKRAQPILNEFNITEPGVLLASAPVTQVMANPRRIDFYPDKSLTKPANKTSYVLKEVDFPDRESCKSFGIDEKGFSLSLTKGGAPLATVYKDARIPSSRGCPMRYTLSDVIEYTAPNGGPIRHVVLVHMFRQGFEGPETRFLAIPVRIK